MLEFESSEKNDYIHPHNAPVFLVENSLVIVSCRLREVVDITPIKFNKIEGC